MFNNAACNCGVDNGIWQKYIFLCLLAVRIRMFGTFSILFTVVLSLWSHIGEGTIAYVSFFQDQKVRAAPISSRSAALARVFLLRSYKKFKF
jgi:hypothetical protein